MSVALRRLSSGLRCACVCQVFAKYRYLAAGVHLPEAPHPLHPRYTLYEYMYRCTHSHRERGGGGGGGVGEPVRI
jgi:hypothetical protein